MTPEQRARLSATLKAKWASGTRKPNPRSAYEKSSATHKRGYAEGRMRHGFVDPSTRERALANRWDDSKPRCSEAMATANARIGEGKLGQPNPPGPSAAGPDHFRAKFWVLITPERNVIAGPNLNHIVRQNAHLFDPRDLRPHGSGTYASKRLSDLFRVHRGRGKSRASYIVEHWKGWRAAEKIDMIKGVDVPFDRLRLKPTMETA